MLSLLTQGFSLRSEGAALFRPFRALFRDLPRNASARQACLLLLVPSFDLTFRDTYCFKEAILIASRLVYLLPFCLISYPFSEEVVHADH